MKVLELLSVGAVIVTMSFKACLTLQAETPMERNRQATERAKKIWEPLLATPIAFYGKVVDQKGDPVPGAKVKLSFADSLEEKPSEATVTTDTDGLFHAEGHGLGIVVQTSKNGYYRTNKSDGNFPYAEAAKDATSPIPPIDSTKPAVFELRKQGAPVTGVSLKRKWFPIPKDGTPVEIDLTTGKVVAAGTGDLVVEAWTHDEGRKLNSNTPYDWRCRLTVPGGGLLKRAAEFDLEAPLEGYGMSDEINMPVDRAHWRDRAEKAYFVKRKNGTYALLIFRIAAAENQACEIESFLNPQAGSRNLDSGSRLWSNSSALNE